MQYSAVYMTQLLVAQLQGDLFVVFALLFKILWRGPREG